jgi:hypothetical protein
MTSDELRNYLNHMWDVGGVEIKPPKELIVSPHTFANVCDKLLRNNEKIQVAKDVFISQIFVDNMGRPLFKDIILILGTDNDL